MDTRPTPADLARRTMLRGAALGAVALPVLVACGDDDTNGGAPATDTPDSEATSPGTSPSGTPAEGAPTGEVLAQTSEIEVGGAVFLDEENIVITQPSAGQFAAFDRTCTHSQCPVTEIQDGKILCRCHNSLYDLATGENVGGPAPAPLTKIDISVEGDEIVKP